MAREKPPQEVIDAITRKLADQGLLVEAGWAGLWIMLEPEFKEVEGAKEHLRNAFFAGADHLFFTIVNMLEEDSEPTEADLRRMDSIATELKLFKAALRKKYDL